jgi:hypothetical protein
MYNLDFDKALRIFSEVEKHYPGHPVNYLLKGIFSYWKHYLCCQHRQLMKNSKMTSENVWNCARPNLFIKI